MTTPASPQSGWITKRDGRLEPFDPDKISRALFAATENLGRPDPFLARELTDSILHFLTSEGEAGVPTTSQVAEIIAKVVRELGQPALGHAYQTGQQRKAERKETAHPPIALPARFADASVYGDPVALSWEIAAAWQREFSLREIFGRDLVAAHRDGLLVLGDLEAPFELAGCVLDGEAIRSAGLPHAVDQVRRQAGVCIALDTPESALAPAGDLNQSAGAFVRELRLGLRSSRLAAVVNLNASVPPSWAVEPAAGPLFAEQRLAVETLTPDSRSEILLEILLAAGGEPPQGRLRVDWHLSERDFAPANQGRLGRLARAAVEGLPLAFTLDRARRPVSLAEGIDRQHPAVLLNVGINLPRLAELPGSDASAFLKRVVSLVRMALSAARQKREFLRRHPHREPAVTRSFLLERARVLLVPLGLDRVVQQLAGRPLATGGAALSLARQVLEQIASTLEADRKSSHLESCIEAPLGSPYSPSADLMAWDPSVPAHRQLRTAGELHGLLGMGTLTVPPPGDALSGTAEVMAWLDYAWRHTALHRLRLRPAETVARSVGWWDNLA